MYAQHRDFEDGLRPSARQDRLITELENTDPTDRAFRDRLRRRFDTLETERAGLTAQLHDLTEPGGLEPAQDETLLDALPILRDINITKAPEQLQRTRPDQARFRIVLTDDNTEALTAATADDAVPDPVSDAQSIGTWPGAPLRSAETAFDRRIPNIIDRQPCAARRQDWQPHAAVRGAPVE
jgi:hypothetical protein